MARILRNRSVMIGSVVLLAIAIVSIFAPQIATHPYWKQDLYHVHEPPSGVNLFGTDTYGRDIFSRVIYGARISIMVAFAAAMLAGFVGVTLGMLAGFFEGWLDPIIEGMVDISWAFPATVMGLVLVLLPLRGETAIIITVIVVSWSQYARVIRAEVISAKSEDYVTSARAIGCSSARILFRQIFPNVIGPVIVLISLTIGRAIILESTLTFLGAGIRPPTASWGLMISDARSYIILYPWMVLFPGLSIMIAVLGFNLIGDGLRDILDPYLTRRGGE